MPLATFIAEMLKSGKITVSANNVEAVEITADNKQIDVNSVNKDFIKQTLAATRGNKSKGTVGLIKSARSTLGMLKDVAEELSEAGITVTLSYKGDLVATMGSKAKPKLSSVVTGTKALEINSPRKLLELGL
ncbi:MAG: hypothetical protein NWE95_09790 [Candidatus Bathyarchaeota archaeon]|nr:hypothetical protein [Candidatus Bathyarchaeota archaeon]